MKKFMLLILALLIAGLAFADTVQIGTGTTNSSNFPIYGLYGYNYSQQIYTQAEINTTGTISKIRFYYVSGTITNNKDWVIYMGHTTKTVFNSTTDWEPLANLTQVFAGNVTSMVPLANNWMEITLTTPFVYNNTSNLIIAVDENTAGYASMSWGAFASGANRGISYYSDGTNPDPATPPTANYGPNATINRIQLVFPNSAAPLAPALTSPLNGGYAMTGDKLYWTPSATGSDATSYDVYFGTAANPPLVSDNQAATNYTPTLAPGTTYYWKVVASNEIGDSPASAIWSFKTPTATQVAESFENTTFPPAGWANGTTGNWTRSTSYYKHGTASAYKYGSTTTAYVLSTPKVTIEATSTLNLWTLASGTTGTLQVVYSPDRVTWTPLGTPIAHAATYTWYNTVADLSSLAGNNYYLGVQTGLQSAGFYVDLAIGPQITPEAPGAPALGVPADLATNVNTYPTLTWTAPTTGGVPTGYRLYVGTDNPPTTMVTDQTALTYTYTTPLAYNTTYYWKAEAYNTAGTGPQTTVRSFTTLADPTVSVFPWPENFDSVTAPALPLGWSSIDNNADGDLWKTTTTNYLSSPNAAVMYSDYNTANDDYLVTPPIVLSNNQRLKFSTRAHSASEPDEISILLSTTTPTAAAFTNVLMPSTPVNLTTYTEYTVDLSAYSGTCYIAFARRGTPADGWNLYVDNVLVENIPAAPIFSLTPTSWDFGQTLINTTPTKQFTISNNGGGTLDISSIGISGSYYTLTVNPAPVSLAAGQSASFTVQYAPTAVGMHEGTVTITDSRAVTTVDLDGVCYDPTQPLPYSQDFNGGTTLAGINWTGTMFILANHGTGGSNGLYRNLYSSVTTTNAVTCPIGPMVANAELKFDYRYVNYTSYPSTATVLGTGDKLEVQVSTDNGVNYTTIRTIDQTNHVTSTAFANVTVELDAYSTGNIFVKFLGTWGTGDYYLDIDNVVVRETPATPIFSYGPTVIDFGTTFANTPTGYQDVTISNIGPGTINIAATDVSIIGTNAAMFSFDPVNLPAALGSSLIPVRYNPTAQGVHTATLRIVYNATNYDVALSGNAYAENAFFESFEGATFPPADWTTSPTAWESYTGYAHTGTKSTKSGFSTGTWWLMTPALEVTPGDNTLSFWYRDYSESTSWDYVDEYTYVMVSTTGSATTDFVDTVWTGDYLNFTTTWQQASIDLSAYNGQTIYVAFKSIHTGGNYRIIDDVFGPARYVPTGPPEPVTITYPANEATGLPIGGFDITWTPASTGGIPTYYAVFMSQDETTIYDDLYFETSNTHFNPVTEGMVSFDYLDRWYFTIQAFNASGSAVVEPARSFVIESDPTISAFPYQESFETHADNTLPSGWTRSSLATGWEFGSDLSSSYWDIPTHTVYAAANDDAAGSSGDGSMDILTMPPINLSGANPGAPVLTFDSYYDGSYSQLAYVEASTDGSTWTNIYDVPTGTDWVAQTVSLVDYNGMNPVYVRFHSDDNGSWASGWAIDNVALIYSTVDIYAPVVDHYPTIGWPLLNTPIDITANVTDNPVMTSGIASVTLYYTINAGAETSIPMTLSGANYTAAIPGQPAGTTVAYYIVAVDAAPTPNTTTTATWDFVVDVPVTLQYDSGTSTTGLGLATGTLGVMTGFTNPYGAGNPIQINSVSAGMNNAGTANVHVFTYDSVNDVLVDVIPSFSQAFAAGVYLNIPLTNCVTTAGYFYVAFTDVVAPNYFSFDQTQPYYPGTHFIFFGSGYDLANLGTVEGSGFAGSWLIRAEVQAGVTTLETPAVSTSSVPTGVELSWNAITGANGYKVLASSDPYTADPWTELAFITGTTYTYTGVDNVKFFKVLATSDSPTRNAFVSSSRKSSSTRPALRAAQVRNVSIMPKPKQ